MEGSGFGRTDLINFQNAISTVPQSPLSQISDNPSMPLEVMHFSPSRPQLGSPLNRVTPAFESRFSGPLCHAVAVSVSANGRPCHWLCSLGASQKFESEHCLFCPDLADLTALLEVGRYDLCSDLKA